MSAPIVTCRFWRDGKLLATMRAERAERHVVRSGMFDGEYIEGGEFLVRTSTMHLWEADGVDYDAAPNKQECSCTRTREYEGGYGMRWVYHHEDPRCPVHARVTK